jgi:hypothetical protein
MEKNVPNTSKIYFIAMSIFWAIFGLIALFFPMLMNMFQTEAGVNSVTVYSDHVWKHDGFDIISVSVLFFMLSRQAVNPNLIRAGAIVALLVVLAILTSLFSTSYWNMLFVLPAICCLCFAVWGFSLASKSKV